MITLQIDDAGWGSPIGSVAVGVSISNDAKGTEFGIVPMEFFRYPNFGTKSYLHVYADVASQLVGKLGVKKEECDVEICRGYINKELVGRMEKVGWNVVTTKIEGFLLMSHYV